MSVETTVRPGAKAQAIIARDDVTMSTSIVQRYPFVIERGLGAKVWDVDGNEYIDFAAGIAVNSTGHCHPEVVKAIQEQAAKFIHIAGTDYYYEVQVRLAERLAEIAPFEDAARVYLCNSGAEAVEAGVKLARWSTRRPNFIAFYGAFHGRTMGALSLTASKVVQRDGFYPLIPGVHHAPYNDAEFIEKYLFKKVVAGDSVAAIIFEPIQGEGGYVTAEPEFAQKLRAICDKYGILLVVDEVQSGIGRSGKWWAVEHLGIEPDIVCSAKGIASGMPLGATIARDHIMTWPPGAQGTTFGGNPISCAAALVTLDLIEQGYMQNATEQGEYIRDVLEEMRTHHPSMRNGRIDGRGLMIGAELLVEDGSVTSKELRNNVERIAIDEGLLILGAGESTIRFCPPLMIERETVEAGLRIFDSVLTKAEEQAGLL